VGFRGHPDEDQGSRDVWGSIRYANAVTLTLRTALTAADVFFEEKSSRVCETAPQVVIPL
jgi:hypothetical protein